jgi:hypothetical protein
MTKTERALIVVGAALYALGIAAGLLTSHDLMMYLPHAIVLAVCCVALPSMLRKRGGGERADGMPAQPVAAPSSAGGRPTERTAGAVGAQPPQPRAGR